MKGIGGNITAVIQTYTITKNEISEQEKTWKDTIRFKKGWLDLSGGDSKYTAFNAKIQESTHVFITDFVQLPSTITAENSRIVINGKSYDIMLIDNPMEMGSGSQLEIYLKYTGGSDMSVEFQDFSIQVKAALEESALKFLEEASAEIESEAKRNTRVDTGKTKGSWNHQVNESAMESTIGSPEQNAIWEELGTGEYSAAGNGRKGGWKYQDDNGDWHFTRGKKPQRTLQRAFAAKKNVVINRAKQIFKDGMS